MSNLESAVLRNLLCNEEYLRKVLPFLKSEYFLERTQKVVYNELSNYLEKYNSVPTAEIIKISVEQLDTVTQDEYNEVIEYISELESDMDLETDIEWLTDETEKFCKDKALYNAIMKSIQIYDDKDQKEDVGVIPELVKSALSISFDPNVGHDYIDDSDERFKFYHTKEEKVPFDLEIMNKITKGGLSNKTLNIVLAGTGVGKSLFMCHCAAGNLDAGKNVLYITLEMAEERIAERIDSNLMDIDMEDLRLLPKDMYDKKIQEVEKRTVGKLIVKEYPTAVANVAHFRHLLNELRLKKNFSPDIIYIDYLNICSSFRVKATAYTNSYSYVKSIAEELRGLAVEVNVPIMSATQTNRTGFNNTDVELTDTSESFGLPATADFMIALSSTEELDELEQIAVKQLKNRYNDPFYYKKFVIGLDRSKMKLYDVEDFAQVEVSEDQDDENVIGHNGRKSGFNFEGIQL